MECHTCKETIEQGDEREFHGNPICEDCYMVALSPAKACDPWAVHSAKSFSNDEKFTLELTNLQSRIVKMLKETGGAGTGALADALGVTESEIERDIATLRHMEKVRGELRDGKKIIRLQD
jgi:hypothetical protein